MYLTRDPLRGYYWARRPWRTDAPAATWRDRGRFRQRHEDERYEKSQLDAGTGLPLIDYTHPRAKPGEPV